jgi:hypothetical protein
VGQEPEWWWRRRRLPRLLFFFVVVVVVSVWATTIGRAFAAGAI